MTKFFARAVAVVELPEYESFLVGLAEYPDRECVNLQLQISLEDKPNEGKYNTYCLVAENQATYYGGITECSLSPKNLKLTLTDEACEQLGVDDGFIIDFEITDKELRDLKDGIQRVLDRALIPFKFTSTIDG